MKSAIERSANHSASLAARHRSRPAEGGPAGRVARRASRPSESGPQRQNTAWSHWRSLATLLALTNSLGLAACRGSISTEPPIHPNPHMDTVPRYDPQEPNPMFSDGRAMRPLVAGTVARGHLRDDPHRFEGTLDAQPAETLPMPLTKTLLEHGRERFNIYCQPCHDAGGFGNGIVAQRGLQPPPSNLHDERLLEKPVGYFFQVMTNGVRTMPSYAAQIPVDDRWAIAAYVRALQLTQGAQLDDVPADVRASEGWTP